MASAHSTEMAAGRRNVLIVGASCSIGPAVIEKFAQRGDRVIGTTYSQTVSVLAPEETIHLDLLDPSSLDSVELACARLVPHLDVVVFLSGVLPGTLLKDYSDDEIANVMMINVGAQAALIRRLTPQMSRYSHIVMTSSISGERGSFDPIYAASKAAIIGLVKSLATWLAPDVRVNALAPGLIEGSNMYWGMQPERRAEHSRRTPTHRITTISEIAEVLANICDPGWRNLNGQIIGLNGGSYV